MHVFLYFVCFYLKDKHLYVHCSVHTDIVVKVSAEVPFSGNGFGLPRIAKRGKTSTFITCHLVFLLYVCMEVDVLPVLACNELGLTGAVGYIGMASLLILFLLYTTRRSRGRVG